MAGQRRASEGQRLAVKGGERRPQGWRMPEIDDVRHALFLLWSRSPLPRSSLPLSDPLRRGEQGGEPKGQGPGSESNQIVVEVAVFGDDDVGGDARPRAAPGEALGGPLPLGIVVAGDDEPFEPARWQRRRRGFRPRARPPK